METKYFEIPSYNEFYARQLNAEIRANELEKERDALLAQIQALQTKQAA